MNKFISYFILAYFVALFKIDAQASQIHWQKSLGGSFDDVCNSIAIDHDGNYLCLGYTTSFDGDISFYYGDPQWVYDYWLCKIDTLGNLLWDKSFGGISVDEGNQIIHTFDGGYMLCGKSGSNDHQVSGNHSQSVDVWLTKLDTSLNIEWQNCFGSTMLDYGYEVAQTIDSAFVFVGETQGNDSDVVGNHGDSDIWTGKVSATGNLIWQLCLGSSISDFDGSIVSTLDGGSIIVGSTIGGGIGYCPVTPSGDNLWVVKLDSLGTIQWERCLGSNGPDYGKKIIRDKYNGYFLSGTVSSNSSNVSCYLGGQNDIWLCHIDSIGNILWQTCLGGNSAEEPFNMILTSDSSVIIVGFTYSASGQAASNQGGSDYFVAKTDYFGNLLWSHCYGGSGHDEAHAVAVGNDGSIVLGGYTESSDRDVSFNHGEKDMWIVKLVSPAVGITNIEDKILEIEVNYTNGKIYLNLNSDDSGKKSISVIDILGRVKYASTTNFIIGKNQLEFDVPALSGINFFKIGNHYGKFFAK